MFYELGYYIILTMSYEVHSGYYSCVGTYSLETSLVAVEGEGEEGNDKIRINIG